MDDLATRLLAKRVITDAGCWEFTGYRRNGYGRMSFSNRVYQVHRLAAYLWLGLDLADLKIVAMHRCDNQPCFNPDHLQLGTQAENNWDAVAKGRHRTGPRHACRSGHLLTPENVIVVGPVGRQWRQCRICKRRWDRERARRLRDESRVVPYIPRPSRRVDADHPDYDQAWRP